LKSAGLKSGARFVLGSILCVGVALGQGREPDGAGLERGTLPAHWISGGPDCSNIPKWQVHPYNSGLYILRESGCANYEKPFLYLFFGKYRALFEDTGAGETNVGQIVAQTLMDWSRRNGRDSLPLVVAHSHAHGDHISGDAQFTGKANVTMSRFPSKACKRLTGFGTGPPISEGRSGSEWLRWRAGQ
jgi:hydroxyacylglutathione hydrolase